MAESLQPAAGDHLVAILARLSLSSLSDDSLVLVATYLSDVFRPTDLCALAQTCCSILRSLGPPVAALRDRHASARSLSSKAGFKTLRSFRDATALNLTGKALSDAEVSTLCQLCPFPALRELELNDNMLGDGGLRALASAGASGMPSLTSLDCSYNLSIGDAGCTALAQALGPGGAWPRLETLKLWRNHIGDRGLRALATVIGAMPSLKALYLDNNPVSAAAKQELHEAVVAALESRMATGLFVQPSDRLYLQV